jgi:hypothetical protein
MWDPWNSNPKEEVMTAKVFTTARYVFAATMVTALAYAGLESASASPERVGIKSCGWEGNPCELAPLVVTAQPAPVVVRAPEAAVELIAQR